MFTIQAKQTNKKQLVNLQSSVQKLEQENTKLKKKVDSTTAYHGHVVAVSFDGEKSHGGIGPIKKYFPDNHALALRAWQAIYESEVAPTIINKFTMWLIGSGLKLEAQPLKKILEAEGIKIEGTNFAETVEARFGLFAKSKRADHKGLQTLHQLEKAAYKNACTAGDVLVILRVVDGDVKVQLVDAEHIRTPLGVKLAEGNRIYQGVEVDAEGRHVAYHVAKVGGLYEFERIEAVGAQTGFTFAYLVYKNKQRIDDHRGLTILTTVLETMKKMERYKEATVGSAEERQKIVYQIVHGMSSSGEDPLENVTAKMFTQGNNEDIDDNPKDVNGVQLDDNVTATTEKTTFNMPIDSEMKTLESKNELTFKEFYMTLFDIICAAIGIPPNVALSRYDDNFSASRAAIKDWENTLMVERDDFSTQFWQPIYQLWLTLQVINNKVQAPGYLKAIMQKDAYVVEAYQNARYVGAPVPHIDPVKEVEAERRKLGKHAENIPLTTLEMATENLGGGDYKINTETFAKELEQAKAAGLELVAKELMKNKPDDGKPQPKEKDK